MSNNLGVNVNLESWINLNGFKIIDIDRNYNNSSYNKRKANNDREVIILNY